MPAYNSSNCFDSTDINVNYQIIKQNDIDFVQMFYILDKVTCITVIFVHLTVSFIKHETLQCLLTLTSFVNERLFLTCKN